MLNQPSCFSSVGSAITAGTINELVLRSARYCGHSTNEASVVLFLEVYVMPVGLYISVCRTAWWWSPIKIANTQNTSQLMLTLGTHHS